MIDQREDLAYYSHKKISVDVDKISTKSGSPEKNFEEKKLRLNSAKFDQLNLNFKQKKKTELCKNWEIKRLCPFNEKCSFAHGIDDIRVKINLHQNFKTLPCQSYFQKGLCSYGKRCQYIHSELFFIEKFQDYLLNIYKKKNLPIQFIQKIQKSSYIQKLQQIQPNQIFQESNQALQQKSQKKRLPVFQNITYELN